MNKQNTCDHIISIGGGPEGVTLYYRGSWSPIEQDYECNFCPRCGANLAGNWWEKNE